MPRGKKTSPEVIYKVMTSWASTNNYSETARDLGMAMTTVEKIVKDNKDKPEFVKLCDEKKKDFAEKATEIIDKGLELINRRLSVALDKQDELDRLIDEIENTDEEELSYKQKVTAINLIRETQIQKIKDISTAVGTLYDKRALARGESTQNVDFATNSETVGKLLEIAGYTKKEADND
jgi:predicted transcriptional regulator